MKHGVTPVLRHAADGASMDSRVRPLTPTDIPVLIELMREHAKFELAHFNSSGLENRLTQALFAFQPSLHGWIAEEAGIATGYATATIDFSTWSGREFVHMDCLFVRESTRGRRIGEALLNQVAELACTRRISEIQWQTPSWNVGALRFYRRAGATHTDKIRFSLLMPMTLRQHRQGRK